MTVEMVAALRVPFDAVPASARARALIDGVLAYVGRFGASEQQLGLALRAVVGEALAEHDDPRGVLVFPVTDALPRAPTYEGVCNERAAAGLWLRPPSAAAAGEMAELLFGLDQGGADAVADARKALFDLPVRAVTAGEVDLEIAALEARARRILAGEADE
jgi:hypothetical protein